ncbi:unnamed protein product [Vitrella brassicaformis CCMP3155]|uniref:OTU domain-containing protein n=1 Tax=Vitrella brassicaformis (strain CCMP3155) TaxID=1169540 RepID=A0A0G4H3H3_VITBC|nr:unnamed protein product [Vitrella brassicaformis CCMP3155]|eukprot:CEM38169.1 unnamed protein product [Vitrella brassicaformis CCMP3155]
MPSRWRQRNADNDQTICRKETGGGGDCLFYSIAEGLASGGLVDTDGSPYTVPKLRRIVARAFVGRREGGEYDEKLFRERMDAFVALEASGEQWPDEWSPSAIMEQDAYVDTKGVIWDTSTMAQKADAVEHELSQCGNSHWGTAVDLELLEDVLDVGFIILSQQTGRVYNYRLDSDTTREHYMLLFYQDDIHFQLAALAVPAEEESGTASVDTSPSPKMRLKSLFSAAEVPRYMKTIWQEDCRQPWPCSKL